MPHLLTPKPLPNRTAVLLWEARAIAQTQQTRRRKSDVRNMQDGKKKAKQKQKRSKTSVIGVSSPTRMTMLDKYDFMVPSHTPQGNLC